MKIYTKHGDDGSTSLYGGNRVKKSAVRLEAYGTIDELNAILGVIIASEPADAIRDILHELQSQLFVLGADLATPADASNRIERIREEHIRDLESSIDRLEEELPPLRNFILPGGSQSGALLHQARTVCRRAERAAVACSQNEEINRSAIIYMNRLSDLLFVVARYENLQKQHQETPWKPDKS